MSVAGPSSHRVTVVRCGLVEYRAAAAAQAALRDARVAGEIGDVLLLLEHPAVYTRGRRTEAADLPLGAETYAERGVDIQDADRGGRVTYHGPGQLVGYPIVSLREAHAKVPGYVAGLERVMIGALGRFGIDARAFDELTGVWTFAEDAGCQRPEAKIGSIGIHVHRGVTTHGFALNVDCDLTPFEWVNPCGLDCRMTSVAAEGASGAQVGVAAAADAVVAIWQTTFGVDLIDTDPAALVERVPAASDLLEGAVTDRSAAAPAIP